MKLSPARRLSWLPIALILGTGLIYGWKLSSAPVYLGGDEAQFGSHANSIAATGRDLDGHFMPLFFRMEELHWWYQPTLFYLIAAVLKFVPLTEGAVRIPTALIGILDVGLLYAVALRLFRNRWYATLGAAMLALSPAHFLFAREARDFICTLPFVLGWLWCLLTLLDTGQVWLAVVAGLVLGAGMYSHIAAWVMLPVYLFMSLTVLAVTRRRPALAVAVGIGFVLPLVPAAWWLRSHPDMLPTILGGYHVYDTRHLSPLQGVRDFLHYANLQERISVYWDYFNPAYLFFSGGSNLTTSTRQAGVFLMASAVFLVSGIYALFVERRSPSAFVLLAGLATAPVGATLVDERYAIQRELFVLPFGVLVGLFGVAWLWGQRRAVVRVATVVLLLSMPLQFGFFDRDYLTDYQVRSAFWFDPANFRDVADYLIAADSAAPVPAVYISDVVDDAVARWRFYLAKHRRDNLWPRTRFFSKDNLDLSQVPSGSFLVLYANDPQVEGLKREGCCVVADLVRHIGGTSTTVILRREPPDWPR